MSKTEKFGERLSELMFDAGNISAKGLGEKLDINAHTIRCWKNGSRSISLSCAIKLADYFKCSLDFLCGRTDKELDFEITPSKPFYTCLKDYMQINKISRYSLVKNSKISNGNFYSWRKGSEPKIQTVIDLANYLQCSMDILVGRDR